MASLIVDDDGNMARQRFKSEANLTPLLDTLDEDQDITLLKTN